MSSGTRDFVFSAAVVCAGLVALWAWPAAEGGGADSLITRMIADTRLRPAVTEGAALPDDPSGENAPPAPAAIAPMRVAAEAPVVPAQCDAPGGGLDAAVIGDKLQLRIFETSILAGVPGAGDATASTTDIIFERLDLSGTYEVDATGSVSLPAIGHVNVAGHSLICVESLVARATYDLLRTENTVSAGFAGRPPILVRGAVRAPGSHVHSPGLTVERVLAQAGTVPTYDPANSVRLAILESRLLELEKTSAGLNLDRMRLEAAIAGRDVLPDDPALRRIAPLLGDDRVKGARTVLAADMGAQRLRQTRAAEHLQDLDSRIETAERQVEIAQVHFAYFDERREQQAEFLKSRMITESRLDSTAIKAMEAEQNLLEKHEALLRLQTERHLALNDLTLADALRESALAAELSAVEARSDDLESERLMVLAETDVIDGDGVPLVVTIERLIGPRDSETITALPTTLVRPGDLITVSPRLEREGLAGLGTEDPSPILQSAYSE